MGPNALIEVASCSNEMRVAYGSEIEAASGCHQSLVVRLVVSAAICSSSAATSGVAVYAWSRARSSGRRGGSADHLCAGQRFASGGVEWLRQRGAREAGSMSDVDESPGTDGERCSRCGVTCEPRLVGAWEIREQFGVSRQRVQQLADLPDFPAPYQQLAMGRVWRATEIRTWLRGWRRTNDGRAALNEE
jgi:hypothetical protein